MKENFHLAITPDGNRRWAKIHDKTVSEGHWAGIEKLRDVARWCKEFGIRYLSLWIFSTENASRSSLEVKALFKLFGRMLDRLEKELDEDTSIRFVGRLNLFPENLVKKAKNFERKTAGRKFHLIILMGYGGRQEIIDAVNAVIKDARLDKIKKVDEKAFSSYLYAPDIPDPNMIIRTAEQRLSGLYPWQGAYSEIYFCPKLWPDFEKKDFVKAIEEYQRRERRFGR